MTTSAPVFLDVPAHPDVFVDRHIGPDDADAQAMAELCGAASLDALSSEPRGGAGCDCGSGGDGFGAGGVRPGDDDQRQTTQRTCGDDRKRSTLGAQRR